MLYGNIGGIMRTLKMPVLVNPFGVVYNPISVAQVLQRSVAGKTYNADELQFRDGLWFSFDFHSDLPLLTAMTVLPAKRSGQLSQSFY
jgi:hypothetical protein